MTSRLRLILLALLSGFSLGAYLLVSSRVYRLGFPLDDAWIHQTYARNLALRGEWAFIPGQPSAGSTAPLWSGLLALGYSLKLGPYIWTYLLGWGLLVATAVAGGYAFNILCPTKGNWALWAGIFLAFEWHLVWAAASGMETLLFALLILLALGWLAPQGVGDPRRRFIHWLGLGVLVGLSTWVRPDGVTLMGPAVLVLLLVEPGWRKRSASVLWLGLGFAALFLPYLAFNRLLAGTWWPNTFFAKQAEYAIYRQLPIWQRFFNEASLPLVGAGVLLLPGFAVIVLQAVRRRAWGVIAGALWLVGYLLLYAWRLPVTYQHGRYVIPAMPVYYVWALAGMAAWYRTAPTSLLRSVLQKTWLISTGLVLIVFWIFGARAYSQDVAIIESEMVTTAMWVAQNTEPQALVAAHDIGALGYFGNRRLLDLAGLVSPEVIPFIRDEARLQDFLDRSHAAYLVTFPTWYPEMVRHAGLIYQSKGLISPSAGGENMAVFRWPGEK